MKIEYAWIALTARRTVAPTLDLSDVGCTLDPGSLCPRDRNVSVAPVPLSTEPTQVILVAHSPPLYLTVSTSRRRRDNKCTRPFQRPLTRLLQQSV